MSRKDEITQYSYSDLMQNMSTEEKIKFIRKQRDDCVRQVNSYKYHIKYCETLLDLYRSSGVS